MRSRSAQRFDLAVRGGVSPISRYRELMLNCARIGFNP